MSDADEMILAGSRPTHGNPIDALHKRVSFVLLIDSFVLFWIASNFVSPVLALIPAIVGGIIWFMYRSKADWAYWFAPLLMGLISGLFCIFLFINVYALFAGSGGSWLITLLIGWATFSSIRFIRIHFHPVYKMGYSGHSVHNEGIQLDPNEMLAACPTCLAVLAVNPLLLSPDDSCPHCESPLVTRNYEEE
jgi:uncharacterized membrane protein (DUF2068 family)